MLQHQRSVDVFHAVKTLRNNKPNMVDLLVRSAVAALLSNEYLVSYSLFEPHESADIQRVHSRKLLCFPKVGELLRDRLRERYLNRGNQNILLFQMQAPKKAQCHISHISAALNLDPPVKCPPFKFSDACRKFIICMPEPSLSWHTVFPGWLN